MVRSRRIIKILGLVVGAVAATTVLAAAIPAQAATLFFDDFADGVADGWTTTNGAWSVVSDNGNLVFQQADGAADARAISNIAGHGTSQMTIVTAQLKLRSSAGSVAVLFQALDANNYAFVALRGGRVEVGKRVNGTSTVLASAAYAPAVGSWQTVTITDIGGQTQAIVSGTSPGVQVLAPIPPVSGSDPHKNVGFATTGAAAVFDNVRIVDDVPPIDTTPPTAPGTPVVRDITSRGFTMSWPASTDNVAVVGYDVTTVVPPGAGAPIRIWRTSTNSITITDLPARSTNTFEVRAFDAVGNRSAPSPRITVTTAAPDDQTPPTAPGTPVVSNVTASGFTLTWAPSTDNVGVTAYYVRNPPGNAAYATSTTTTATLTGLAPGTAYTVVVVATDAAANISAPSPQVTVTTLANTCRVSYRIVNQWPGGFQADVTITNTGAAAVNGWNLQWTFPNAESVSSLWNAYIVSVTGGTVTVRDAGWNAAIAPGASVSFGFNGTGVPVTPAFALNGSACS